jgi:ADP-heptose:LPS heptosyltransferase
MLNDDVVVHEPQWLDKLSAPFGLYQKAALSGPHGTCQSLHMDFNGYCGVDFEYLCGSMLMCKTAIVKKHGLFADYLKFAYCEDSTLSLRMRVLGYTLHKVRIHFEHAQATTSRQVPGIAEIAANNRIASKKYWQHYLNCRKMDFPITVKRMAAHGDVLLITPIIRQLAENWPNSPITVETLDVMQPIFAGNPHVKKVVGSALRTRDTMYINLDMSYENKPGKHVLDAYAEVANVTLKSRTTELFTPRTNEKAGMWVAVHPGPTTWVGKNWPMDRWNELCRHLRSSGYKVVLVGHGNDIIACDRDIRGRTSIDELAREISACDFFVGVDSFPIHVAQAIGVPVVGLFGVTNASCLLTDGSPWVEVADKSVPEYGSRHTNFGNVIIPSKGDAMKAISVEMVIQGVLDITKGMYK